MENSESRNAVDEFAKAFPDEYREIRQMFMESIRGVQKRGNDDTIDSQTLERYRNRYSERLTSKEKRKAKNIRRTKEYRQIREEVAVEFGGSQPNVLTFGDMRPMSTEELVELARSLNAFRKSNRVASFLTDRFSVYAESILNTERDELVNEARRALADSAHNLDSFERWYSATFRKHRLLDRYIDYGYDYDDYYDDFEYDGYHRAENAAYDEFGMNYRVNDLEGLYRVLRGMTDELSYAYVEARHGNTSKAIRSNIVDVLHKDENIAFFKRFAEAIGMGKHANKAYENILDKSIESIADSISWGSWDMVLDALRENKQYGELFARDERIKEAIVSMIPKNPIDAYPIARSMHRRFILHIGPTNSGKTHDAIAALSSSDSGAYLGPLRLLAYEQFETLNESGCPCSLLTGEESIDVSGARHVSSTIEMVNLTSRIAVAVIDEAQMISDPDRGHRWVEAIVGVPADEIHVCLAPEAEQIVSQLIHLCGDNMSIEYHERMVPLSADDKAGKNGFSFPRGVRKGDALIVFSRKMVHAVASELSRRGKSVSMIYGALPHDVRHNEAERFANGETDIVVSTDAIGMGMNLPVKRIVFLEQSKFDGHSVRFLNANEVRQIAGRAGRYGMYKEGLYTSANDMGRIKALMDAKIPQIKTLPIGFPKSLVGVDEPLIDVVKKWVEMPIQEPFSKLSEERMLGMLERIGEKMPRGWEHDLAMRTLAYEFATMPFDEKNISLVNAWESMLDADIRGKIYRVSVRGDELGNDLGSLEEEYAYLDLMFQYSRKHGLDEKISEIDERRTAISKRMMKILSSSTFESRRCHECGCSLPWNWPYPMCDECHEILYRHRWY